MDSSWPERSPVAGSSENVNKPSGSMKGERISWLAERLSGYHTVLSSTELAAHILRLCSCRFMPLRSLSNPFHMQALPSAACLYSF
jgi:hypothetical protein